MADDFDAIFETQAPAANRPRDEFDDLFTPQRNSAPAELRVQDAVRGNPQAAADRMKAAKSLGEPFALTTPESVPQARARTAASVVRDNPFVQDYIEKVPGAADVSADDLENLNMFSKAWKFLNEPEAIGRLVTALGAPQLGTGVRKGYLAERQGLAYLGGDREAAKKYEDEIKALPEAQGTLPYYAEMVGSMIGMLGLDAGTGGLLGGAAGSVVPVVGTGFGAAGGIAAVNSNAAMGRFLMNLDKAAAETGKPVDQATRLGTAAAFGAINTGANMIGIKAGAGAAAELMAEAAARAAVQPGVAAAVGRAGASMAKGGAIGGGLMSTVVAAEAILSDAAKYDAGQQATIYTDPARREEVVGQLTQAFADGFVLMGGLHAIPAGKNFVNDVRLAKDAAAAKDGLQTLMDTREASATWQRMPELMAEYGRLHGDQTLTVTGEGAAQLPEGLGTVMPDGAREVPLAEYVAAVPMDLHKAIADDIAHGDGAISVNEGKLLAEYHSATRKFATREQPPAAANEAGAVFDTWESRREGLGSEEVRQLNPFMKEQELLSEESAKLWKAHEAAMASKDMLAADRILKEIDEIDKKNEAAFFASQEWRPDPTDLKLPDYQTGKPTVVDAFHGTNADFIRGEGFSEEKLGTSTKAKSAGEATFFARNPATSNAYMTVGEDFYPNPETLPPDVRAKLDEVQGQIHDFEWNDDLTPAQKREAKAPLDAEVAEILAPYLDKPNMIQSRIEFKNPFVYDFKGADYREVTYYDLIIKAKEEGHDGAIFLNTRDGGPNDVIYAVFNKDSIKHRLDNNARRAAEGAQGYLARDIRTESMAANTRDPVNSGMAPSNLEDATPQPDPVLSRAQADMDGMYLTSMFPDPAAVGMTAPEFARYSKLLEARANTIRARSERRAARDAAAELTPTYKAREEAVREEVTRNVDDRPAFVAERMARTGDAGDGSGPGSFKLDREAVDAVSRPGTSDLMRGLVKRGGMHPDELAGLVGAGSGPELVQELVAMQVERQRLGLSPAKYRDKVIAGEVTSRMEERYGLLPEQIEAQAREAAVMPATTEILNAEREFLASKAGAEKGATLAEMRQGVAVEYAALPAAKARDLKGYMRSVARAGREAELALLGQDFAKAFDAKQRQQVAHLFAEQAKAFIRTERKAGNILRMYSENVTLDAVSQRYVDQVQGVGWILGIKQRRDERDLWEVLRGAADTSLEKFITARNAELGGLIPDAPLPPGKRLEDYTVADTTQLHDLLQALDFQGRAEKKISVMGEAKALADIVAEGVKGIEALPDRFNPNRGGIKASLAKVRRMVDAPLLKMEQLFEWFDHHDTEGVFHQAVVKPLHSAQGVRDDLFVMLGKQLRKLDQGRAWNRRLKDEIANTTLPDHEFGGMLRFTRKELLGLMLNMGNRGNFEVLTKGYQWDPVAVVDFVNRNATKEDWAWVQGIWDTFGSMEGQIKSAYRELAGVAPEMIEPNEIVTPLGTFKGGYFPLIRDVLRKKEGLEKLDDALIARNQIQPLPANGYTKSRTGSTYALALNPDYVPAYLRATAHDIAFRGAVINAAKFLLHPEIQSAVKKTFGPEYAAEFLPYLKDIANDGVSDIAGIAFLNQMIAGARNATIASLIGLNPGTVIIHGGSAGFNSIGELAHQFGWKNAIASLPKFVKVAGMEIAADAMRVTVARLTKNPVEFNKLWNEAMDQSVEMRHRMHNFDRDLNTQQNRALGKKNYVGAWNNFATGFVAYSDLMTAVPTFIAARDLAMANGHSLTDAIAIGEKTVRQAHGSAGIVDRARVQRGTEFQKVFTMFYGYFSHNYNRNRNTYREAKELREHLGMGEYREAGNVALKVTTAMMFYAILPSMNHAWVRHPRDEKDSWAKWMAGAMTTQFAGDIPFVRDVVTPVVSGYDAQVTPLASSANVLAKTINNALIASGAKDEKLKHGAIRDAIHAGGIVAGAGTRQIGVATEFVYDVSKNKEHPQDFWEWWRGFTTGHAKEKKH